MKIPVYIACVAAAFLLGSLPTAAQQMERNVAVVSEDVAGRLDGFSFREGPESKLEFRGTALALAAEGSGEVEYQDGRARVDVSVRKLPDPASLGPYTTYVLWAVAADGAPRTSARSSYATAAAASTRRRPCRRSALS